MARKWKFCSLSLLYTLILLTEYCAAKDTLTQSQQLSVNQSLVSGGEIFELGFFSPGNSRKSYIGMWYKNIPVRRILWVANRENPLLANDSASSLKIGNDGNIRLVDGKQRTVWSTNVSIQSNSKTSAVLTDKGELILKDTASGVVLWNSFDFPCDTIIPGMYLGYDIRAGMSQELSSWKSEDDPSPGNFRVGLSQETPPQAFTWIDNSKPYWRSGPWNGWKFIGIQDEDTGYSNGMNLIQDNNQGTAYFSFNTFNRSYVSISIINPLGRLQINLWDDKTNAWDLNWEAPDHLCDVYGTCGPFSVCDKKKPPFCDCLRGFVPKLREEWSKGNWTSGCVRRTELLCEVHRSGIATKESKNDTFLKLTGMKLPDHFRYLYDQTDASCRRWCLDDCSCVAYAYPLGIGCMVWTSGLIDVLQFSYSGEDLYLRLANSEFGDDKRKIKLIASLATVTSAILMGILIYMICRKRVNQKGGGRRRIKDIFLVGKAQKERDITGEEMEGIHALPSDSSELPMIGFDELAASTNDFSNDNKLGAGGFGSVYKGILANGQEIAVKRLSTQSAQGVEEFKNEILLISKLQHRNLVRLLGCSIHGEEKLLVYELMKNKSLDNFLFDKTKKSQLDWAKRFSIIQGIARGILYLHRDSCLRIIHRDLKASNILLDMDMNAKISDFGLARPFRVTEELANTHRVVGTFGYMSPEYVIGGLFSEKSDVYSFGVLLLEIVSGRRNSGFFSHEEHISLLSYAWQLWIERREVDLIDESISNSCSFTEALRCIRIGLLCVQDHASDRPTMSNVVLMLCSETDIPRPKQPTFTIQSLLDSDSRNEITVSMTEGR